ncbi:hypothetical protein C4K39_3641 [Pseudomonas sessilinigenes]|nr:hypothetical protein C4K39_3641 [Pseudomonas sessilinigenes]
MLAHRYCAYLRHCFMAQQAERQQGAEIVGISRPGKLSA